MTSPRPMSASRGMLSAMAVDANSGLVRLIIGPAEFLAERAVADGFEAAAAMDADFDRTEIDASDLAPGALIELTSPSLFARVRAVVIRQLPELDDDVHDELVAYAEAPVPDVVLMLVHSGSTKGKRLLDRLRKLATVDEVRCDEPKPWELARYVSSETKRHGGSITNEAAEFLLGEHSRPPRISWSVTSRRSGSPSRSCAAITPAGPRCAASTSPTRRSRGGSRMRWSSCAGRPGTRSRPCWSPVRSRPGFGRWPGCRVRRPAYATGISRVRSAFRRSGSRTCGANCGPGRRADWPRRSRRSRQRRSG